MKMLLETRNGFVKHGGKPLQLKLKLFPNDIYRQNYGPKMQLLLIYIKKRKTKKISKTKEVSPYQTTLLH